MKKDEALKLALEALEDLGMKHYESTGEVLYKETFTAIKEALAQPAQGPAAMNDRQRLEAIVSVVCKYLPPDGTPIKEAMSEIISLIDPLPEQPVQEPVAHVYLFDHDGRPRIAWDKTKNIKIGDKLYTAPPQRQWIWLSDADIAEVIDTTCQYTGIYEEYLIKKAERKSRSMNT